MCFRKYFHFSEVKKITRRKSTTRNPVKVCPICLSLSIKRIPNPFLGLISPPTFYCQECQYQGPIYAEIENSDYQHYLDTKEASSRF
ncbi:hypothetical protein [Candidatus Hodarchaeum mangrovi]